MKLAQHVALGTLVATSICWAADLPALSLDEQIKMDRALLGYYVKVQKHGCGQRDDLDCYVVMQEHAPSQQFLDSVGGGYQLKPWPGAVPNSKRRVRQIDIGRFKMVGANTAQTYITEECGTECGSLSRATLKRTNSGWIVQSLEMTAVK